MIPIQCEYFALEGLGKLLNTVKSVQKIHNNDLDIEGMLLTCLPTAATFALPDAGSVIQLEGLTIYRDVQDLGMRVERLQSLTERFRRRLQKFRT